MWSYALLPVMLLPGGEICSSDVIYLHSVGSQRWRLEEVFDA